MNKFLLLLLLLLSACIPQKQAKNLFNSCSDISLSDSFMTKDHRYFKISYPANWEEKKGVQGLIISSNQFEDSAYHSFMLSVFPKTLYGSSYRDKPNPLIDYVRFEKMKFKNHEVVFLTRNDLGIDNEEKTVFWRSELRFINSHDSLLYLMVFGQRSDSKKEPSWCDFKEIIESFEIK